MLVVLGFHLVRTGRAVAALACLLAAVTYPHLPLNRWPAPASGCPPAPGRSSGWHGYHRGEPLAITPAALSTPAGVLASHRHHDHAGMAALAACADHAVPVYAAVEPPGEPER
jgi:L-ascorbate metabolism protein UlaG (beta-lactamase superfamily)